MKLGTPARPAIARTAAVGALALMACGLASGPMASPADARECRAETHALLEEWGVPRAEAQIFFVEPDRISRRDDITGYSTWVRLSGCDGSLVFRFNRACQFRFAYSRGDCELPPGADH